ARLERPVQLAARDDIRARAPTGKGVKHSQIGVGLDRVADEVTFAGARYCLIKDAVVPLECCVAVDIGWRLNLRRDARERYALTEEVRPLVCKMVHVSPLACRLPPPRRAARGHRCSGRGSRSVPSCSSAR